MAASNFIEPIGYLWRGFVDVYVLDRGRDIIESRFTLQTASAMFFLKVLTTSIVCALQVAENPVVLPTL